MTYKNTTNNSNIDGDSHGDSDSDNDSNSDGDSNGDSDANNEDDNTKKTCIQDELGRLVNFDHIVTPSLKPCIYLMLVKQDE